MLVKNFLNPTTGEPDRIGFEQKLSRSPLIAPKFKTAEAPEGFPLPLDQILPEFREGFRRQDLDGDGVITLEEAQELLPSGDRSGWQGDSPYNYGQPRVVRFGAEFRF